MQANGNGQHQGSCVDQPLTRDGRARMRVFIACLPCRKNKRRCDGIRPICSICKKKGFVVPPSYVDSNTPEALKGCCIYDIAPKRRGPDRTPRSRLKRNNPIDDDERPAKRRRSTHDGTLNQEPQPCGGVVRPNEEANSDQLRTILSQGDRSLSSACLTVATTGHKWKRQDTEDSIAGHSHLRTPPTSVLTPGVTTAFPSSSASRQFTHSSLLVTKGSIPSIVVPGLDHELAPRSVSSSKSYSPVSSSVIFDSLGQPFVSPNALPVLDPRYVLPISGVTTGNYHSPYSTHGPLPPEYDFRQRYIPFIQFGHVPPPIFSSLTPPRQEECDEPTCKSCTDIYNLSQWDAGISLPQSPSADYIQKTWYESLLVFYASFDFASQQSLETFPHAVSTERRLRAQSMVTADLRRAFAVFTWWTSFINVPYFFSTFHDTDRRSSSAIQPALVLAALALSVLFTGSEAEGGEATREKAGMLRDLAQAALESSLAVGWIDCNLAKAAWVREKNICPGKEMPC